MAAAWLTTAAAVERADLSLPPLDSPPQLQLSPGGQAAAEALAHYSTALQFEGVGKMREALTHYLKVVEADPANAELAMHAAELAYNFKGRAEAIALLERALANRPNDPAAYLNLARFCATYAPEDPFEKDRVGQTLELALKRFPKSAEVYGFAAVTYLSGNQREQAVKVLEQAAAQEVKSPKFWLAVGRVAQQVWPLGLPEKRDEHTQRVNPFFEKALSVAGEKAAEPVQLEVAQYYLLTNQLDKARTLCEQISTRTGNLQARKLLYRLYEAAGEKEQALATLQKIVQDAPADVEQQRLLATVYQGREEYARAVPHLEAAIQIGGGDDRDYLALGELLLRSQLFEKAVQVSQRAVKLFPDTAMFHVLAARAHRLLQHTDSAITSYAAAAEIAEANQSELIHYRFYYEYGMALERGGRFDEAARVLERSITLTPKEDYEEAANTMNYLGYMWLEQDQHLDKAGELIQKANQLHPDNAAYIDSLGWWHYKKGEYEKAVKELQRAIGVIKELQPEDAEIVEHLGHAYVKLNEPEKAREQFLKARDLQPKDEKVRQRIEEALKRLGAEPKN
ncbi:MAG TPA: tetratricopeptide repeat protein [Prosthecobacter sp.]|nr:tetratricopeptide repeat protein [Prosthecobacter sp.]